jgi:hypothetical protein
MLGFISFSLVVRQGAKDYAALIFGENTFIKEKREKLAQLFFNWDEICCSLRTTF